MKAWFYVEADKVMGPLTVDEMDAGAGSGLLEPETPVWCEGMPGWTPVAEIEEFVNYFQPEQRQSARSRMPAILPPLPLAPAAPPPAIPAPQPQPSLPPPPYAVVPPSPYYLATNPPKSKLAAGLFGIFLGVFGVHRFYLGYTTIGLVMLLITVLSCGFGAAITSIWGLVEGILCLTGNFTDVHGRPLTD